jgi:AcrR family transcriptional regulator
VSRPTLYHWFPSTGALLAALGEHEEARYDAGIAAAIADVPEDERLDAILQFIVSFQHSYSLRRLVDIEPDYVVRKMAEVLPVMRDRLLPYFPGPDGFTIATVVIRVALSHNLLPDDNPALFLSELRHAAGLPTRAKLVRSSAKTGAS